MNVTASSSVLLVRNKYVFKNVLVLPKSPYKHSVPFAPVPPIRCQHTVCVSISTVTQHLNPLTVDWTWGSINWPAGHLELNRLGLGCWRHLHSFVCSQPISDLGVDSAC